MKETEDQVVLIINTTQGRIAAKVSDTQQDVNEL
jgi:hypothetical protein